MSLNRKQYQRIALGMLIALMSLVMMKSTHFHHVESMISAPLNQSDAVWYAADDACPLCAVFGTSFDTVPAAVLPYFDFGLPEFVVEAVKPELSFSYLSFSLRAPPCHIC